MHFYPLAIKDIRKETNECISVAFDIPPDVAKHFNYKSGQNITLKLNIGGQEIRRTYSICSGPQDNELRIAIKKIPTGIFSRFAYENFKPGDIIEILPPTGNFGRKTITDNRKKYLTIAAGSGITPVIAIIKDILFSEPESIVTLIYGNKNRHTIIFRDELNALKNRYVNRLVIHHIFSREKTDIEIYQGRINTQKLVQLSAIVDFKSMNEVFLCGPEEMIMETRKWLLETGVPSVNIHYELFAAAASKKEIAQSFLNNPNMQNKSHITVRLDGTAIEFDLLAEGPSILDAALKQGADLPFSCKGGVCATCKARLVSGKVYMEMNYALEEDELAAGFILTCQSHPASPEVVIDFDHK